MNYTILIAGQLSKYTRYTTLLLNCRYKETPFKEFNNTFNVPEFDKFSKYEFITEVYFNSNEEANNAYNLLWDKELHKLGCIQPIGIFEISK